MKKVLVLLLAVLTAVSFVCCAPQSDEPTTPEITMPENLIETVGDFTLPELTSTGTKRFYCQELSIMLPDDFEDRSSLATSDSMVGIYAKPDGTLAAAFIREEKSLTSAELSADDYLEMQHNNTPSTATDISDIKERDGIKYFDYVVSNNGYTFKYFSTTYVSSEAYWMVQFYAVKNEYDEYLDTFLSWADSVILS